MRLPRAGFGSGLAGGALQPAGRARSLVPAPESPLSEPLVFVLVLLAALMHASWNALVKSSGERWLTFAVVAATGACVYLPVALWLGAPPAAAWPYLAGSGAIHVFYFACLLLAYAHGDFSQVYPIARGIGPLVVAAVSLTLVGEPVRLTTGVGVLGVSAGVMALASGKALANRRGAGLALATGVFIAGYTVCDGLGVRASKHALAYIAALHVVIGVPFSSAVFWWNRRRLLPFFRAHGARAVAGGALAALAYSLVIFAMSRTQLSVVAALREVSVVFAALIGVRLLGEPLGARRVTASVVVVVGIVCLSLGR